MDDAEPAGRQVRELLREFTPSWIGGAPADQLPIGESGLGLDSIAIVELLVACEERFGVAFPDALLEDPPLTVGRLVEHLASHARASRGR